MVTRAPLAPVLTEELLRRCGERAATYDRENRFFSEDFEELRQAGYLTISVPREFGGQGLTLADQVFPLFLFTVGASMPFSRRAQRPGTVLRRVVVLFLLGSLLVSAKQHGWPRPRAPMA